MALYGPLKNRYFYQIIVNKPASPETLIPEPTYFWKLNKKSILLTLLASYQ